jgi:type II secretory pathway component GspD/PulD (secretin)
MKTLATTCATLLLLVVSAWAGPLTTDQKISLALEEVPITAALNMIATQNELNLVVAGEVSGNVTVRLDDVDIATALDAILTANGFNYFLKDNVIIVKPTEADAAGELDARVVRLKYIDPVTARKALAALKSLKGTVTILDRKGEGDSGDDAYRPNRIIISDYPNLLDRMMGMLSEIDVAERSIMIEAKIIETTIDSESNLGITWPTSLSASLSGAEGTATTDATTVTDDGTTKASGVYDPNNGSWTWGKLSVGEVN